jgi:hypothetical protein
MFVNIILNLLQQQQTNEKLQRKTLEILNIRLKDEFTPENEVNFLRKKKFLNIYFFYFI